jgi:hypothetical protein
MKFSVKLQCMCEICFVLFCFVDKLIFLLFYLKLFG